MATCDHLSGATWRKHCSPTVGQPPPDHRLTVVNGGSQRWSTAVITAGPPVNGGGQRRSKAADHRRPPPDHRRTTGQPTGHGPGQIGSWAGSGSGKFHFPTNFVVVDYVVDPRVPLILGSPFLRTRRALIDVYREELTLRHDDEAVTFKVGQTLRYSYNDVVSINRIDVSSCLCAVCSKKLLRILESILRWP
ncbi:reverse transcriptase domain-containing protein [Tanacetum coccineum]|uniref:Reverse transcriptase domain-containing protein n=1 Tax=Tanacetum coccineum TaxID=301880 RepID=A0ABQ5ESG8_9ASTR